MSSPSLSPEEKLPEPQTNKENTSMSTSLRKEIQELDQSRMEKINELTAAMSYLNSTPVGLSAPLVDSDGFPRDDLDLYAISAARHTVACAQNDLKAIEETLYEKLNALHEETRQLAKEQMASTNHDNKTNVVYVENEKPVNVVHTHNVESEVQNDKAIHEGAKHANPRSLAEIEKLKPFLRIAHVDINSPASEGNLRADDLILQVSAVNTTNTNSDIADREDDDNNKNQDENNNNRHDQINVIDASNYTQFGEFITLHEHKMLSFYVRRLVDEDNASRGERTEVVELFIVPQRWVGAGLLGCAFDVMTEIE